MWLDSVQCTEQAQRKRTMQPKMSTVPRLRLLILNISNRKSRDSDLLVTYTLQILLLLVLFFLEGKYNKIMQITHAHRSPQEKNTQKNTACKNPAVKSEMVVKCFYHCEIYFFFLSS